jgi:hypothetical protein
MHETVASITLLLVIARVLGVARARFARCENLTLAMVTGCKQPEK